MQRLSSINFFNNLLNLKAYFINFLLENIQNSIFFKNILEKLAFLSLFPNL